MASVAASLAFPVAILIGSIAFMIGARNESYEFFRFSVLLSLYAPFLAISLALDPKKSCHGFLKSKFPRLLKHSEVISEVCMYLTFLSMAVFVLYLLWMLIKILGPLLLATFIWCVDFIGKIVTIVDRLAA